LHQVSLSAQVLEVGGLRINGLNRRKNLIRDGAAPVTEMHLTALSQQIDKIKPDPWKPSTPTL
jgi:hypothetical protein